MRTEEKLKKIINYTSESWKGCFTDEEKEENLETYLFDLEELKKNPNGLDNSLNWLVREMNTDIYNQDFEETIFTYKEVLKTINAYISLVINGGMDYSKAQF